MSTIHDLYRRPALWSQITETIVNVIHDEAQSADDVLAFANSLATRDWRAILELRDMRRRMEHEELARIPSRCSGCGLLFPQGELHRLELKEAGNQFIGFSGLGVYCADCAPNATANLTRTCQSCGELFLRIKGVKNTIFCPDCASDDVTRESRRVQYQLARARQAGVEASLTVSEWLKAIKHFNGLCAYCRKEPFDVLEHYIPISQGGGTTADNCVPACFSCNSRKGNRHPHRPEDQSFPLSLEITSYFALLRRDATISSTDRS